MKKITFKEISRAFTFAIVLESAMVITVKWIFSKPGPDHPISKLYAMSHLVSYFLFKWIQNLFDIGYSDWILQSINVLLITLIVIPFVKRYYEDK
jgi:hypothetical protein